MKSKSTENKIEEPTSSGNVNQKKTYAHQLVRTDHLSQKLEIFMEPKSQNISTSHPDNPPHELEEQGSEIEIIESTKSRIDDTVEKSTLDNSIVSENISKHGEKRYPFCFIYNFLFKLLRNIVSVIESN